MTAAKRATAFWVRIRDVVRSHYGDDWPRSDVDLMATRRGRPIWKVGEVSYTLQDERLDPADDRVIEITTTRYRVLAPNGRVAHERPIGPGPAPELN